MSFKPDGTPGWSRSIPAGQRISLAWCQKQGYPQVKEFDVDSKKVKAETLDGRFCSKSKCRVFDQIVCTQ